MEVCRRRYRTADGHPRDREIHRAVKRAFDRSAPYAVVDGATGGIAGCATALAGLGRPTARALFAGAGEPMRRTARRAPAPGCASRAG